VGRYRRGGGRGGVRVVGRYRSSPGHAVLSARDAGICVATGASATPAASSAPYTSGSRCSRSSRHLAMTMCGCTICGAAGRNAAAAADSTSGAGFSWSRSSTTTSCPARASSSEANSPAAPPRRLRSSTRLPPAAVRRYRRANPRKSQAREPAPSRGHPPATLIVVPETRYKRVTDHDQEIRAIQGRSISHRGQHISATPPTRKTHRRHQSLHPGWVTSRRSSPRAGDGGNPVQGDPEVVAVGGKHGIVGSQLLFGA
jgi:hypothetical protein